PTTPHYEINVLFDVTNNTESDYVLPVDAWQRRLMETQSGVLLGSAGWEFSLSQATHGGVPPRTLPADFFTPKPVLIPAHSTVEILAAYDSAYSIDAVKAKTREQVLENEFRGTTELVVFDDAMHYRINFPIKGIWETQPSKPTTQ